MPRGKGRPRTAPLEERGTVQVYIKGGDDTKHLLKILAAARQQSVAELLWDAVVTVHGDQIELAKKFVKSGTSKSHSVIASATQEDSNG